MLVTKIFDVSSPLYKPPHVPKLVRDNDLDLLRFLLAACVVFFHSRVLLGGLDFAYAHVSAIPIFLFLSGLLITESFYGSKTLKTYVEKRIRRIYPGYIVVVILGGMLAYFGWSVLGAQNIELSSLVKYWGLNAVFANWVQPCITPLALDSAKECAVNGSLWVIKWEIVMYALLPAILIVFSRLSRFIYIIVLLGLAVAVSLTSSPYLKIILCFLMGICTYFLKPVWMSVLGKLPPVPQFLRQIILILAIAIGPYFYYGFSILLMMLICFYPSRDSWKLNVMKYGDISYGVFLIHFPLITAIFQFYPETIFGPFVSFVVLGISIILSAVLYKFIERPFLLKSSHYRKEKP